MPLTAKYGPSDMRTVLRALFTPMAYRATYGSIHQPSYYETDGAIIFPPVSDTSTRQLETIEETLAELPEDMVESFASNRKMLLFPIAEEQKPFGVSFFSARNHWVTLHYDPITQIATLIDSRPTMISSWYSTDAIQTALRRGLARFNLSITAFNLEYQSIQYDNIYCGAWTAWNIRALTQQATLPAMREALARLTSEQVTQYFIAVTEQTADKNTPVLTLMGESPPRPSLFSSIYSSFLRMKEASFSFFSYQPLITNHQDVELRDRSEKIAS